MITQWSFRGPTLVIEQKSKCIMMSHNDHTMVTWGTYLGDRAEVQMYTDEP